MFDPLMLKVSREGACFFWGVGGGGGGDGGLGRVGRGGVFGCPSDKIPS